MRCFATPHPPRSGIPHRCAICRRAPRVPAMSTIQGGGWETTSRAREQAEAADLGRWLYTLQLEREEDRKSLMNNVAGLVVGLIVTSASIMFLVRAHPEVLGLKLGGVALSALGLGFVAVCGYRMLFKDREGIRGILLGHVYEAGLVLERTRGQSHVVPRGTSILRHVAWDAGGDERPRDQLWITLPDGTVRGIETWSGFECRQLAQLATHFGMPDGPERIAPVHPADIPELL